MPQSTRCSLRHNDKRIGASRFHTASVDSGLSVDRPSSANSRKYSEAPWKQTYDYAIAP